MDNISLSGNSISLTYPSVLQLNLEDDCIIKDGYGTYSALSTGTKEQQTISIGEVILPNVVYNNQILLREDTTNQLIFSSRLYVDDNNDIIIHNIKVLQKSTSGDGILISDGDTMDTIAIRDYLTLKSVNVALNDNRTVNEILGTNDNNYIIAKMWVIGTSGNGLGNNIGGSGGESGTITYQGQTWNLGNGIVCTVLEFPYDAHHGDNIIKCENINLIVTQVAYLKI